MIKTDEAKGDWNDVDDDEDDNWDDWGDAEDNIENDCNISSVRKANIEPDSSVSYSDKRTPNESQTNKSWGSVWKPFGGVVTSVFSTATEGLGSITSTVSQVIGVPEPDELARINVAANLKEEKLQLEEERCKASNVEDNSNVNEDHIRAAPVFGLNLVSGVTTLGTKVLNTGLDTLEGIGKRTMTILQENDPLLINKRKMLGLEMERPNLSEILKEAKHDSDQLEITLKELMLEKSKEQLRFDNLFENFCGLVHMEALEILSTESALKVQSLLGAVSGLALAELQETLNDVKELVGLEDLEGECDGDYNEDELNEKLMAAVEDADIQINFDDLKRNWKITLNWLSNASAEGVDVDEIFARSIGTLAEICALEVNKLHKIAELLLIKEHHSTANEVDSTVQLCKHFTLHLSGVGTRFAAVMSTQCGAASKEQINALFTEVCHATKMIEKAYKLFLPILQLGAV